MAATWCARAFALASSDRRPDLRCEQRQRHDHRPSRWPAHRWAKCSEKPRRARFAQRRASASSIDIIGAQLAFVRTLRGLTLDFGSFDDGEFDERPTCERRFGASAAPGFLESWYWIRKLQARSSPAITLRRSTR